MLNFSDLVSSYLGEVPGADKNLEQALTNIEVQKPQIPTMRETKTSLLFTDIVNSSTIFDKFGDEYGREIVAIHDNLVKPIVSQRGGVFVKGTGDGILASFESCGRSVKTAILIHQKVVEHNTKFPLMPIDVRIGINVGSVIKDENDLYGSSVNLAARITDIADPGSIYSTGIVYARCKEKEYQFVERGFKSFKGFDSKIPIYEVIW